LVLSVCAVWSHSTDRTIALPILHTAHEGSHAIFVDLMTKMPCVFTISELLDTRFPHNWTESARQSYFSPSGPRIRELYTAGANLFGPRGIDGDEILPRYKICADAGISSVVIALIRSEQYVLDFIKGDFKLILLARTNIVKKSLSMSPSESVFYGEPHPQFSTHNISIVKRHFPIADVGKGADLTVRHWISQADFLKQCISKRKSCKKFGIITYEDYLNDPYSFIARLYMETTGGVNTQAIMEALAKGIYDKLLLVSQHQEYRKVHSDDISTFVSNYEEIMTYFKKSKYPSFEHVMRKIPCDLEHWML